MATATITGTAFTAATQVWFGGTLAPSFTVNSATQITATVPPGVGTVAISVVTPGGTSPAAVSYTYPTTCAVYGLGTTGGPAKGGASVQIQGAGFTGATAVRFGAVASPSFYILNDSQIVAVIPTPANAITLSVVDVTVVTPSGTSPVVAADQFTYDPLKPTVTAISVV
jgi:hypothetical protein